MNFDESFNNLSDKVENIEEDIKSIKIHINCYDENDYDTIWSRLINVEETVNNTNKKIDELIEKMDSLFVKLNDIENAIKFMPIISEEYNKAKDHFDINNLESLT